LVSASFAAEVDDNADTQFLEGLRERGLYQLAEAFCTEQIAREDLSELQRAELTIELSRAMTEQAVAAPPAEREPLWRKTFDTLDQFINKLPNSPRLPLVQFQKALTLLTRGELARQEAELSGANTPLWDEARKQLREAVRQLQVLADETVLHVHRQNVVPNQVKNTLTPVQWDSLQKSVHYELARALRNQAICYPAESTDRANSLTQALKLLDPLSRTGGEDRLIWQSRLDRIICCRLLQDYESARVALDVLEQQAPPPEFAQRSIAEGIRLALAKNDVTTALKLFDATTGIIPFSQSENRDSLRSAELDLAGLEAYLAAWCVAHQARQVDQAASWRQKADTLLRRMGVLYGPYWLRRSEMLLAGQVFAAPGSGDLAMLVHAAENAYRSGHLDDALAAYDRAHTLAEKEGTKERAFDLAYTAATIEHQRNHGEQALVRYRRLALAHPENPKAAEAHHLGLFHAGRLFKEQPKIARDDFVMLLQEHLQRWPNDPKAGDLRRRLGGVLELQRRWPDALAAYQAVAPDDPKFEEVVSSAERCCLTWFSELRSEDKPTAELASKAATWFEASILTTDGRVPERLSPAARAATLAAARLRLFGMPKSASSAQDLLATAMKNSSDASPEWKSAVQALMICALAQQGKMAEAQSLLAHLSNATLMVWMELLNGLRLSAEQLPAADRKPLAELLLKATETAVSQSATKGDGPNISGKKLVPSTLYFAADQRLAWERIRAQALADAGRTEEAVTTYHSLERQAPDDLGIKESLAQLLIARPDSVSQAAAMERWKTIVQKTRPGNSAWLKAQYGLALIHYRQGKKAEAARNIRIVELSYPELGGKDLKQKYLELLDRCQ
jgi:hypothetical protein